MKPPVVILLALSSASLTLAGCSAVQPERPDLVTRKQRQAVAAVQNVPGDRSSRNTAFVEAVAETNVRLTVERIRELSPILRDLEREGRIQIIGCIYNLEAGRVHFLAATGQ